LKHSFANDAKGSLPNDVSKDEVLSRDLPLRIEIQAKFHRLGALSVCRFLLLSCLINME
jgi:hypothetical protein